ncbi:MAG: hypothetical protein ACD_68C00035G0003 [uncultured bacterium]|nr:MAG: hypothetical protein ACD_68C00035G0003 [uncultured bacterium]
MNNQQILESISLPEEIKEVNKKGNASDIVIQPCYPGFGSTLGNALRRVLLSSLDGAAVTAVKIKGVDHEFSAISHIKEDVLNIIMNLKTLRLQVKSAEPIRMTLKVSGKKEIKALDIKSSSDVEIVNPDHHIAHATHPDAKLEMEMVAEVGRGYVPVEQKDRQDLEVGMILIDSIFTPVLKVGYQIDNMRVGQMTNYDRLTLQVETDGTITPLAAVTKAAEILIQQFQQIAKPKTKTAVNKEEKIDADKSVKEDSPAEPSFENIKLSVRTRNALKAGGVENLEKLAKKSAKELLELEGFGNKALTEVRKALEKAKINHLLDS